MNENMQKWHLRFAVTARCNYRCPYCNPEGLWTIKNDLSVQEITEILTAVYNNGIERVHWTGGEPTIRDDLLELVKAARDIGFQKQIITTNGWNLDKIINDLIKNGLTRVIASLDTLESCNEAIKQVNDHIINGIKIAMQQLKDPTKISCVTMKSTLPELKNFVSLIHELNNQDNAGKLILKLNQFFPSNPAQLTASGQRYWLNQLISVEEILATLNEIGNLIPIKKNNIEGDNPSYQYFKIEGYDVIVGVLGLFSWKYPCGRCHKLRILPSGKVSICLSQEDFPSLVGKSIEEKTMILHEIINFREVELDKKYPNRHHFRPQLGGCRFGDVHLPKSMDFFYKLVNERDGSSES